MLHPFYFKRISLLLAAVAFSLLFLTGIYFGNGVFAAERAIDAPIAEGSASTGAAAVTPEQAR